MLLQKEEQFQKIISGHHNAYHNFLNSIEKKEIKCQYSEFFNFFLLQDDISKCDYYGLYDIFTYYLDYFNSQESIKIEDKLKIGSNLLNKIISAAKKGHIAAQCCLLYFYEMYNRAIVSGLPSTTTEEIFASRKVCEDQIRSAYRNALSLLTKTNVLPEKKQWANVFLGMHNLLITKEKYENVIKYLLPAHNANNAVATHYLIGSYSKPEKVAKSRVLFEFLKKYDTNPRYLISLNIAFAKVYLNCLHIKETHNIKSQARNALTEKILHYFSSYNFPVVSFLKGYCELLILKQSNELALDHFRQAEKGGYKDATDPIKQLEAAIRKHQEAGRKKENNQAITKKQYEDKLDRNFLFGDKEIRIHQDLHIEKNNKGEDPITPELAIEDTIFSDVLKNIENNNNIRSFSIEHFMYNLDVSRILKALELNKNIQTFKIINCQLKLADFVKILLFVSTNSHIQHLILDQVSFKLPGDTLDSENREKCDKIITNNLFNFLSKIKHLKTFSLIGIVHTDEQVKDLLLAIQKNPSLQETKITLNNIKFNNDNLLLLADILNKHLCHFSFFCGKHDFDAPTLNKFAKKLQNNTNLKSFEARALIPNDDSEINLIKASHFLFKTLLTRTNIESLSLTDTIYPIDHSYCMIKDICESLKNIKTLKELKLKNNFLDDFDLMQLAYIFKTQNSINRLKLSYNIFTHKGIEVLADVLSHFPNNLQYLSLVGMNFSRRKTFEPDKFFFALAKLFKSPSCMIEELCVPYFISKKNQSDYIAFYNFLSALQENKRIKKLSFSGVIENEMIEKIIKLTKVNTNIVSLKYCRHGDSDDTIVLENITCNENLTPKEDNADKPIKKDMPNLVAGDENKKIEPTIPKANIDTFKTVLNKTKMKYELAVDDLQKTITIQFDKKEVAQSICSIFNTSKSISNSDNNKVIISNFTSIDEREILSLTILFSYYELKEIPQNPSLKTTLLDTLYNVKQIACIEEENNLILSLSDSVKLSKEKTGDVMVEISTFLVKREIKCTISSGKIVIVDYKNIPENHLAGFASEVKKIIKDQYTMYKSINNNNSFFQTSAKIKSKPQKSQQPKKPKTKNLKKELTAQDSGSEKKSEPSTSDDLSDQNQNSSPEPQEIEYVPYSDVIPELPTEEKFRKLMSTFLKGESDNLDLLKDKLMSLILSHHNALLNVKTECNDNVKLAYFMLYHAIRISELTHYYLYDHHRDIPELQSSAYESRTILADRADYFLPNAVEKTISYLQSHSHSFLTVSRQILLDLFEKDSHLKTKMPVGYSTLVYYKEFFENQSNNKNQLPLPKTLIDTPTHALESMKSLIAIVKHCLCDISDIKLALTSNCFNNLELGALKGAIFLLGHYARIIRDYHTSFLKEFLPGGITRNNYSWGLKNILFELFESQFLGDNQFNLLARMEGLNQEQILKMANCASFADYCLLFISARNTMGHNNENYLEDENTSCVVDEIPIPSIVYLCSFFIQNSTFQNQLDTVLAFVKQKECEPTVENYNKTETNSTVFKPDAPVFTPRIFSNNNTTDITEPDNEEKKRIISNLQQRP